MIPNQMLQCPPVVERRHSADGKVGGGELEGK